MSADESQRMEVTYFGTILILSFPDRHVFSLDNIAKILYNKPTNRRPDFSHMRSCFDILEQTCFGLCHSLNEFSEQTWLENDSVIKSSTFKAVYS